MQVDILIASVRAALADLRAQRLVFVQQARAHCRAARTLLGTGHPAAGVGQLLYAEEQRSRARHAGVEIQIRSAELAELNEKKRRPRNPS